MVDLRVQRKWRDHCRKEGLWEVHIGHSHTAGSQVDREDHLRTEHLKVDLEDRQAGPPHKEYLKVGTIETDREADFGVCLLAGSIELFREVCSQENSSAG
jgi:hypothetical protein